MEWEQLLIPEVQAFINQHIQDDVRNLALRKMPDDTWHAPTILDQIKVRQRAATKTPQLARSIDFIFPASDTFEQASSEACAAYKASIISGKSFIDFTAGSGIDSYYLQHSFSEGTLIEMDEISAALLQHNFKKNNNITVYCKDSMNFIDQMPECDLAYIDPQRRKKGRKGIYDLESCSPNIIELLPKLSEKAKYALIKTSPILDIEKTIKDLHHVKSVHVLQWDGECKEVLYLLDFTTQTPTDDVSITASEIDGSGNPIKQFTYTTKAEKQQTCEYALPQKYIYEPGRAFFKAGGYKALAHKYNLKKLHQHTHLFTSDEVIQNFPGKYYEVIECIAVKPKNLTIKQADITIRNFPSTVDLLYKKLRISRGGEHRIFAVTVCDESKKLIICKKS